MTIEHKAYAGPEAKLSSVDDADMTFTGYAAVFGNVDAYGDVITKGAFAKSLAGYQKSDSLPLMFLNHDAFGSLPIGKWMTMEEDDFGLKVTGQLLDTTTGRDAYVALKSGAISGLSIGFFPVEWTMRSKPEEPRRTLKQVELIEVSVVSMPANAKARVQNVKSFDADELTLRDLESLLRELGLSKSQSERVCSQFESKKLIEASANSARELAALEDRLSKLLGH